MRTMPRRPIFETIAGRAHHAKRLNEFVDILLSCCRPDASSDAVSWQLLYYGPVKEYARSYLLAVLAEPETANELWLTAELSAREPWPSLAHDWPALLWPEREVWEHTGFEPLDHPSLEPMLQPHRVELTSRVSGAGVFSLPLGPVRADVSESAFFLFDTVGEQIMHLQPQLFYKHRGIEQLAVGQSIEDVLLLAERTSGTSTASHASAYAIAVEQAMGWSAPDEIRLERALWVELERMYNHVHDLSQLASAAGMTVGQAQLARVKEECLRLCADLTGSRYLRGAVQLFTRSGVDWKDVPRDIEPRLADMERRVNCFVDLLVRTPTFMDRLLGTGVVTTKWASDYALVGPTARACGLATDVRQDFPIVSIDTGYEISLCDAPVGDAKSRFDIRVREWQVSLRMVRKLARSLANLELQVARVAVSERTEGWGVGCVEGPRGRIAHVVAVEDGRVRFFGIRSASSWIWPVFGLATSNGNIQTDFPVIDASFGLSYAGLDR